MTVKKKHLESYERFVWLLFTSEIIKYSTILLTGFEKNIFNNVSHNYYVHNFLDKLIKLPTKWHCSLFCQCLFPRPKCWLACVSDIFQEAFVRYGVTPRIVNKIMTTWGGFQPSVKKNTFQKSIWVPLYFVIFALMLAINII